MQLCKKWEKFASQGAKALISTPVFIRVIRERLKFNHIITQLISQMKMAAEFCRADIKWQIGIVHCKACLCHTPWLRCQGGWGGRGEKKKSMENEMLVLIMSTTQMYSPREQGEVKQMFLWHLSVLGVWLSVVLQKYALAARAPAPPSGWSRQVGAVFQCRA